MTPPPSSLQVLSDEVKRKQYDTYGTAGFDPGSGGARQQYWGRGPTVDPEELFRKIFGEFSGSPFGDFQSIFDQPQEVGIGWSNLFSPCRLFRGRSVLRPPCGVLVVQRLGRGRPCKGVLGGRVFGAFVCPLLVPVPHSCRC